MTINGTPAPARRGGIYYGWVVVAATHVVLLLGFGAAYSFTTFFDALQTEFAASRGAVSFVFSLAGFLYFGLGAVAGPLADRFGSRWVVTFGVLTIAAGLLAGSRAETVVQIYLAYGFGVGVGVGFAYTPAVGAVQRWFDRRRGMASGFAVSGIGLGTLCVPPATAVLITATDWRTAYVVLGLVVLVVGGLAAYLIHGAPHDRGLAPDGAPLDAVPDAARSGQGQPGPARHTTGASIRQALLSRPFVQLYLAFVLVSVGLFIPFVHLVPYAKDAGLGVEVGVYLLALVGIGSTLGRFMLGGIADRIGRRPSLAAAFAGTGAMCLFWLVSNSIVTLSIFAFVFGTCYGWFVALAPAVVADYFGYRNVSGLIGLLYTSVATGTLIGPWLAGVSFDLYGSYTVPIVVGAVAALGGAVITVFLEDPVRWQERAAIAAGD